MPLRDYLTTDQITQAVLALLPGEVIFIKDGHVMKANFRTRVVSDVCPHTKKKTKRGRRGSK